MHPVPVSSTHVGACILSTLPYQHVDELPFSQVELGVGVGTLGRVEIEDTGPSTGAQRCNADTQNNVTDQCVCVCIITVFCKSVNFRQ